MSEPTCCNLFATTFVVAVFVILGLVLFGCTPTFDVRIHRNSGEIEKIETWREHGPSIYLVCLESNVSPVATRLECMETQLR